MEKYNKILQELIQLFPHSTDIRIEVDTNEKDLESFTKDIKEFSKTNFYVNTGKDEPEIISSCRSTFGKITINKNGK
jgi:hypothetical protein